MENLPRKFGRYTLLELLATGGMAHIYRAELSSAEGMTKELVIKRILPHLVENKDFITMFIDEARITMPLNHGNIVQVFEFSQEGRDYFLAMELVRGRNLETVLSRARERGLPLPVPLALHIGSEIAKGLDYAHRFRDAQNQPAAIIHRDVSPQNVLIGFQGEVKLTDFGIAKARSRIHQTGQGIIRGKAVYLSPEQAECADIDPRSDQFSLGSVIYEMLTQVRPFEGQNEVASLQKVREARIQAPSRLRPDVPPAVDAAVQKALNREPARRFATCGDFQVALSRALHEQDPEFTSARLAEWMHGLFSQEITHEIADRSLRDRLVGQLNSNGERNAATTLTTGEMLEMGTMAISTGDRGAGRGPRRGWLIALVFVLLAGGAVGLWLLRPDLFGRDPVQADPDGGADGAAIASGDDGGVAAKPGRDTDAQTTADGGLPADGGGDPDPAGADAVVHKADRSRPPRIRYGYLNLNASPWALVEIDGRRQKKETPLFKVRVTAGTHRLRFFNPKLNIEKTKVIRVRPNQTRTISVQLGGP